MSKVTIRFPEMTLEEARQKIRELDSLWDPEESLRSLIATMDDFEGEYGMSTVDFYARFRAGKMGDGRDFIKWAGAFELYTDFLANYSRPQLEMAAAAAK